MDKYYREQLNRLRVGANEFARRYPAIAPMLFEEGGDPDVERILEGTAWLCAKIQEHLDQTAPDLIQALLRLIFPQAVLPYVSTTLIRFTLAQGFSETLHVPQGTQIASHPVDGVSCLYTTILDLDVLPLQVANVSTVASDSNVQTVKVTCTARAPLKSFLPPSLKFYLTGSYAHASQRFLLLLRNLIGIKVTADACQINLPPTALKASNLPLVDQRLAEKHRGHRGYMDILRYFNFPEQLLCFELQGLEHLQLDLDCRELSLEFYLKNSFAEFVPFSDTSLTLNVVPAENIFPVPAEPIQVDHSREEYVIHPQDDHGRFLEILSIKNATCMFPGGKTMPCLPYKAYVKSTQDLLYSIRYRKNDRDGSIDHLIMPIYKMANKKDLPDSYTLSMLLLCCNHSLPSSLQVGDICRPTDTSPAQATFTNITPPSHMCPRPQTESLQWRFLAHMHANLLSLASAEALRQFLAL